MSIGVSAFFSASTAPDPAWSTIIASAEVPGGEDAVFAAERAMLERHGHEVLVYERSNEEAAHGLPKALLPLHAVWNRAAARDVKHIIQTKNVDAVHIHNTLLLLSPAVVRAAKHTDA